MILDSVAWVAVALAAIPLVQLAEVPLKARWPSAWPAVRKLTPWLIGLGPAYLALITGAVLARDFGLYGRGGVLGWSLSTVVCAALVAAVWRFRGGLDLKVTGEDLVPIALDEPRWALYRAAGALWFGTWGVLIGLAVGAVEWGLWTRPWQSEGRLDRWTWLTLGRLAVSSLLFALTGNIWLTWFAQTASWAAIRDTGDPAATER